MATSPVRIRDEDKAALERLRREVAAATGEKPTQQDIAGKAFAFALRHRDEFVAEEVGRPWTEAEWRKLEADIRRLGGWDPVAPEDIDDIVYGDER